MADFGIVETGFNRKRYLDIRADLQSRARANFGENIITDTDKPLGKFIDLQAWALSELWEQLENTYNSIAIDTATGTALDRIVKYKGIRRRNETIATVNMTITGNSGTVVPLGFIVSKEDGTTYTNLQEGTIPQEGSIQLPFVCTYGGSRGNANVGAINLIVTPITGINGVTNERLVTNGQDYETDPVLRQRYIETVGGLSTVESIRAAVAAVEGVVSTIVIENPEQETDSYGIPPKSFQVFVYGGDDMEVAQAILDSKAAGIRAYGQTIIEPVDLNGYTHQIGFTRAEAVNITIKITITRNQFWPINGIETVKYNILNYIGGVGPDGTQYNGLRINEQVINSFITSLVWPVTGIVDVKTEMSRDGNTLSEENIPIGEFEIARTSYDLIEVVFTS